MATISDSGRCNNNADDTDDVKLDVLYKNPALMPSVEKPGYNSLRVQKAYRINGIESGRLEKQLQLLERQKVHSVRLVNQEIRITRITLEHIEACSGCSAEQEGFWGAGSEVQDISESDKPMFLYGERKVSRRVGKYRRIQSAMTRGRRVTDLEATIEHRRPKSSIPTFSEIKDRVQKQLDVNPDWDPNTELPDQLSESEQERLTPTTAWAVEKDSLPTQNYNESNKELKSRKQSAAVSWKPDLRTAVDDENNRSEPDGASTVSEIISAVGKETTERNKATPSTLSRASTAKGILKTKGMITQRRPATRSAKSGKSQQTISTLPEPNEPEDEAPLLSTEKLIEKLEEIESKGHRSVARTQTRNPRDHPTFQLVNRARVSSGRAKKFANSGTLDPELDQTGPRAERELITKQEKLAQRKGLQDIENIELDVKVSEYLIKHPALSKTAQAHDPTLPYDKVKEILVERRIPLHRAQRDNQKLSIMVVA